ncbi:MAG: flagellin, partial [Planctomycetota bacterium]
GSLVGSSASAQALMGRIDTAIADVSEALSYIGSVVNRLSYQESSLTVAKTNTEAARSRIEDADMAYEQLNATKLTILQQTASAMLAQANSGPQSILSLFR